MAQQKTIQWLEEKIAQEERRLQALEDRRTNPNTQTTYESQGTIIKMLVPSFHQPTDTFYIVPDREASIKMLCNTTDAAGLDKIGCRLLNADIGTAAKINNKYNTTKYPRVLITTKTGTPERKTTEWGATWLKDYTEGSDGQSHRLIPFGYASTVTTNASFEDVLNYFELQFSEGGDLYERLGSNWSASLILGKNSTIASISRK